MTCRCFGRHFEGWKAEGFRPHLGFLSRLSSRKQPHGNGRKIDSRSREGGRVGVGALLQRVAAIAQTAGNLSEARRIDDDVATDVADALLCKRAGKMPECLLRHGRIRAAYQKEVSWKAALRRCSGGREARGKTMICTPDIECTRCR